MFCNIRCLNSHHECEEGKAVRSGVQNTDIEGICQKGSTETVVYKK